MASPALHIKDSYYFEVPKMLWRTPRKTPKDFPDWWIKLDPDYQLHEAELVYAKLTSGGFFTESELHDHDFEHLKHEYEEWKHHDHANFGKPFNAFLKDTQEWFQAKYTVAKESTKDETLTKEQIAKLEKDFAAKEKAGREWLNNWDIAVANCADVDSYVANANWDPEKISGYEKSLEGKILIPQPFGTLKNLHEPESGFCVSKFMVLQLVVAFGLVCVFKWLGTKVQSGDAPKGRLWNFLETILVFLRDEVARPAIGKHDADRFVPLLWTIFLFILGCNLLGMLPWAGAPTSAFGVTFGMACVTFGTVIVMGSRKFGPVGFWLNQVPHMELPFILAIIIKPMIFLIEILGLFIKHGVLAVRLLANMVAGHLVLLGIMGLAFSVEGAMSDSWAITAVVAVVASTLFSVLELFVAFLQAYIFTFLSALFIGAAIHHH